jgi:23S rRNA (uracil1939-C5)-methyltransferase
MVHGGACLSRFEETTVFVDGGIPGEEVVAELRYRKKKVWFASVAEVVVASPHRVDAPCVYFGTCGGCQLQHVSYEHQLELKREIVADALRRQRVEFGEITMHGMDDPWRYRWRGEFHVVRSDKGAELGFNRQRSWRPIAVDDCLIHHQTITEALPLLREMANAGDERLSLVHVTVGERGDELLVRAKPANAVPAAAIDEISLRAQQRWSTTQTLLHWGDKKFAVTPESFIQVNQGHLPVLYGLVLDALRRRGADRVLDAYAGSGMLAILAAEFVHNVTCIESNPSAVAMGRLNAEMNGVLDRVHFVGDLVENALAAALRDTACDTVILDPPRAGCANNVNALLALAGPETVIYVSCEPSTLARDLRVLTTSGPYRIESVDAVDMFAQTYHVETVVVMRRS